jgi:hypothetical protein
MNDQSDDCEEKKQVNQGAGHVEYHEVKLMLVPEINQIAWPLRQELRFFPGARTYVGYTCAAFRLTALPVPLESEDASPVDEISSAPVSFITSLARLISSEVSQ